MTRKTDMMKVHANKLARLITIKSSVERACSLVAHAELVEALFEFYKQCNETPENIVIGVTLDRKVSQVPLSREAPVPCNRLSVNLGKAENNPPVPDDRIVSPGVAKLSTC